MNDSKIKLGYGPDKPTVPDVMPLVNDYYRNNGTGGALHLVLDDGNVDDSHVSFCLNEAAQNDDLPGVHLALLLLRMSKTQRLKLAMSRSDVPDDEDVVAGESLHKTQVTCYYDIVNEFAIMQLPDGYRVNARTGAVEVKNMSDEFVKSCDIIPIKGVCKLDDDGNWFFEIPLSCVK